MPAFSSSSRWLPAIVLSVCALGSSIGLAADRPNVVLILADDLGYGDLRCYNSASKIPTPHLDRMAAGGMRFTDAHTPSSVCTPTRYGLLTGRYCWRTRLKSGVLDGLDPALIETGRPTLATLLRQQGYVTGAVGKWHLGMNWVDKQGKPLRSRGDNPTETFRNGTEVDYAREATGGRGTAVLTPTSAPRLRILCWNGGRSSAELWERHASAWPTELPGWSLALPGNRRAFGCGLGLR